MVAVSEKKEVVVVAVTMESSEFVVPLKEKYKYSTMLLLSLSDEKQQQGVGAVVVNPPFKNKASSSLLLDMMTTKTTAVLNKTTNACLTDEYHNNSNGSNNNNNHNDGNMRKQQEQQERESFENGCDQATVDAKDVKEVKEEDDTSNEWLLPPPPPATRRYVLSSTYWWHANANANASTPLRHQQQQQQLLSSWKMDSQEENDTEHDFHHHNHHTCFQYRRRSRRRGRRQREAFNNDNNDNNQNNDNGQVERIRRWWGWRQWALCTQYLRHGLSRSSSSNRDDGCFDSKEYHHNKWRWNTNSIAWRWKGCHTNWWFWQDDDHRNHHHHEEEGDDEYNHGWEQDERQYGSSRKHGIERECSNGASSSSSSCHGIHMALAVAFACTSVATTIPMTLIPTMARDFFLSTSSSSSSSSSTSSSMTGFVSSVTSQAVSYAVLGTACGKFLTGWMVDVVGARRMSRWFSMGLGMSLLALAMAPTTSWALVTCFLVEFFQAIQWPSLLVILATHHQDNNNNNQDNNQGDQAGVGENQQHDEKEQPSYRDNQMMNSQQESYGNQSTTTTNNNNNNYHDSSKLLYEQGIYMTSLTSRLGSLVAIPFCSWYLQHYHHHHHHHQQQQHSWRQLAMGAATLAWLGSILTTYFIQDAPNQRHQPQNPIQPRLLQDLSSALYRHKQQQQQQQQQGAWNFVRGGRPSENGSRHHQRYHEQQRLPPAPPQLDLLDISNVDCNEKDHWNHRYNNNNNNEYITNNIAASRECTEYHQGVSAIGLCQAMGNIIQSLLMTHLLPSLRHVMTSGIFWMISIAHVGSSLVRTSDRILATYFVDTFSHWQVTTMSSSSYATTTTTATTAAATTSSASAFHLTQELASACSVSLSVGMMLGLTFAGSMFQAFRHQERRRKRLVTRLYLATIASCYLLALLSLPPPSATTTNNTSHWWWPSTKFHHIRNNNNGQLIFIFQVMVSVVMGFGIAIPYYQIPSLVIADSFGHVKGLASSYMDGVAYGLSTVVWHIVGATVSNRDEDHNYYSWMEGTSSTVHGYFGGSSSSSISSHSNHSHNNMGWAYGWSAVALMVVISAITMVEFMEHYFVRKSGRYGGTYETILLA